MKKFLSNMKSLWYVFLPTILLTTLVSTYFCDLVNAPTKVETLSIFVGSYTTDNSKFKACLEENKPSYLKVVNANMYLLNNQYFGEYYYSANLLTSDMFILPRSRIIDIDVLKCFAKLVPEVISPIAGGEREYYQVDGVNYGLMLRKKGDLKANNLLTYALNDDTDEDYFIFYSDASLHVKGLNDSEHDAALTYTRVLLNA